MVSVALPRLFTPGDVIDIPVTVFVLKDHIREVTVKMTTDDKITLTGEKEQHIQFDKKENKLSILRLGSIAKPGCRHFGQKRHRAMKTAIVTEDVQVRIPNPRMTEIEEKEAKSRRNCFFRYPHYRNRTGFCPGGILYPTVKPGTTPQLLARLPSWLCRANHFTGISAISFILASGIKPGTTDHGRK